MTEQNEDRAGRRAFLRDALAVTGGLLLAPGCTPEDIRALAPNAPQETAVTPDPVGLPDNLDPAFFWLHKRHPLGLESKRSSMGAGVITPVSRFFVRNNLPMPPRTVVETPDAWSLAVEGVAQPMTLTLPALRQLGLDTVTAVLQCSGNGRKFFAHGPSGSQWATGAAGCAVWTGVRVSTVVEHLGGVVDGARFMTSTGGDPLPDGVDPQEVMVERSVPIEKGLRDCLLAWEMNGEPIPLSHGGPLRMIVPGYYGCNQVKYVRRLRFEANESEAKIQRTGYRIRPIGQKGDPSQPSMWRMNVKSWVNGPGADQTPVLAGRVVFHGVAFSGERAIEKVDVTLDDGKTWSPATLASPDLGVHAWRGFQYAVELPVGTHRIASRATDVAGDVQPAHRVENHRGYGHNGWRDMTLSVSVVATLPRPAPSTPASGASGSTLGSRARPAEKPLSPAAERGKQIFLKTQPSCVTCHSLEDAGARARVGPSLDRMMPSVGRVKRAVTHGVGAMPGYGRTLTEAEISDLAAYVAEATRR